MTLDDWLGIAGLFLGVQGALIGTVWMLVQRQIARADDSATNAHKRIDHAEREHMSLKVDLAEHYVRRSLMREEFDRLAEAYIMPLTDRLQRLEMLVDRIADRLQVPRVD